MRLFRLEWRRINKKPYLWGSLGLGLLCMFIAVLMTFLPQEEIQNTSIMSGWRFIIVITTDVTLFGFAILAAVINAKVLLEDYIGKRVLLLFSYPIKRGEMFRIKAVIAWGIPVMFAFLANTVSIISVGIAANVLHAMPEQFGAEECVMALLYSVGAAMTAGNIGLLSLWFGFWKASVTATIVSALIISIPITNLLQWVSGGLLPIITFFVVMAISLAVFRKLKCKIQSMEVE